MVFHGSLSPWPVNLKLMENKLIQLKVCYCYSFLESPSCMLAVFFSLKRSHVYFRSCFSLIGIVLISMSWFTKPDLRSNSFIDADHGHILTVAPIKTPLTLHMIFSPQINHQSLHRNCQLAAFFLQPTEKSLSFLNENFYLFLTNKNYIYSRYKA